MNPKFYFFTNTKMSKNIAEILDYLAKLDDLTKDMTRFGQIDLAVAPSYPALYPAGRLLKSSRIMLGAQNVCISTEIEHSGEVSAPMLLETGVKMVMIGHSERRRLYGETNQIVNRKVKAALECGLIALFSISELKQDRTAGVSEEVLRIQVKEALRGVDPEKWPLVRVLYEPAWAVGASGEAAPPEYAGRMHRAIRSALMEHFGEQSGRKVPILYGGSVNRENAVDIALQEDVGGLGIGRAAWKAEEFDAIIRMVLRAKET